jgi:hypothetical protein
MQRVKPRYLLAALLLPLAGWAVAAARAADLEAEPIRYTTAAPDNAVARLQERLAAGRASLTYEPGQGYLRSLLRELAVPVSSQVLVFSKTSLQRQRIGPHSPRAVYFNDEVYVGYCRRGDVMEISAVDPKLGTVFYTVDQKTPEKPVITRQNDSCMICHGSSQNQGLPGHLVRSVYADGDGYPILSLGTHRTDQRSPLAERWGGWYVTGTSGTQGHLGNLILADKHPTGEVNNEAGRNVTDLGERFDAGPYLSKHSDIVALMVLEHQAEAHNLITRAGMLTRMALHEEEALNRSLGKPPGERWESTTSRIRNAGEPLVKYLLFSGEAKLTERVCGTSGFAEEFARRGPRDARGRSLRDFDLERRLFKYPCSYLVYSPSFDALPGPVKDYVLKRVWEVLSGRDTSPDFAHLSAADRRAVLEILLATKPGLPGYWSVNPAVSAAGSP